MLETQSNGLYFCILLGAFAFAEMKSNNGMIKLYSVQKKGFIMSEKVNKTDQEWKQD